MYPQRWKLSDPGLVRTEISCFDFVLCLRLVMKNSKEELLDALGESPDITLFLFSVKLKMTKNSNANKWYCVW